MVTEGFDPLDLSDLFDFAVQSSNKGGSEQSSDSVDVSVDWRLPSKVDLSKVSTSLPRGIPPFKHTANLSPTQTSPKSLIPSTAHETLELLVDDISRDPRLICVLDHPGRYAQFKHYLQSGCFNESFAKRMTLKDSRAL
jgi:hypothetical protein